jgi:predicted DNA-binding protein with PD1-like motif
MTVGKVGRIGVFRLSENDDLVEAVKREAEKNNIRAGAFIVIGSVKRVVLGYFKDGEYKNTLVEGPLEVASCMGNIAVDEKDEVIVHAHIVVADEKGEAFGGHLMKGSPVGATAELVMVEATGLNMQRVFDEKTKLRLLRLS